jgi:hypothetical protein
MGHETGLRSLDRGGPFVLHEEDPPPPCGHGVCVETLFDTTAASDEITLSLRRTERHDGGPAHVDGVRATARVSLTTGLCVSGDAEAERLFAEHAWLRDAFVPRLAWLRERARRDTVQQDRTTCFAALQRASLATMLRHDDLFPGDWDLLFQHEGKTYWAIDHHCSNAACTCEEIVVALRHVDPPETRVLGELRIDLSTKRLRPKASSAPAVKLFQPLWSAYGPALVERYHEVRRAVRAHAAARDTDDAKRGGRPARNAPCPCGSGKKYKRCCADRDLLAADSRATSARSAR